jgi:hypothetical protein
MKKYLLFIFPILLFSCAKKSGPKSGAKLTTTIEQNFIPNWHSNDTLIGMIVDSSSSFVGYDTIYTNNINDTSFVIYKGIQYYIWTIGLTDIHGDVIPFQNDTKTYANCCINIIPFDTTGAISFKLYNSVFPDKYLQSGAYIHQQQEVIIQDNHIIKPTIGFVNGGVYISNNIY